MTPFEQMWETSRNNAFSGQTTFVNLIAVMLLLLVAFIPHRVFLLRWVMSAVIVLAAAWITTDYSSREIEEKWRIRYEYAKEHETELTEDERHAVTVDGANRLLGPLMFGAFATFKQCGIVLLVIFGFRYLTAMMRRRDKTRNEVRDKEPADIAIDV
jgi:hypothetical protein